GGRSSADLVKGRRLEVLGAFSTDFTELSISNLNMREDVLGARASCPHERRGVSRAGSPRSQGSVDPRPPNSVWRYLAYGGGAKKARLMVLLDIGSRWAGGWSVVPSRNRRMALEAVDGLREGMASLGRGDLSGAVVHHDKDSVYTSHAWLRRLLLEQRARLSYAERGARDNPWIESFRGRFETENAELLLEAETVEEVRRMVGEQLDYYNRRRKHSALDYRAPYEVVLEATDGEDRGR
ncbi:MAG: integrase core domain-containing protein, partial [Rubrobacteraceae bacterium]